MNRIVAGAAAGLAATVALSMMMMAKGVVFGIFVWLGMIIMVTPMAGSGLFGMAMGIMASIMTLVLRKTSGVVIGVVFGLLTAPQPDAA